MKDKYICIKYQIHSKVLHLSLKKGFTKNKPEEFNDQTLSSEKEADKYTKVRDDMKTSSSSIFRLVRFQQKLKF